TYPSSMVGRVADCNLERVRRAATRQPPAEVVVLRHGHLLVPELVGDLAGRQLALVQDRRTRLAEDVARDPTRTPRSHGPHEGLETCLTGLASRPRSRERAG